MLNIALLIAVLGTSLTKRGRSLLAENRKLIFCVAAASLFAFLFIVSALQYRAMAADPFARLFLPPHQSLKYFVIAVAWARIFAPYVTSFLVSLIFLFVSERYNRKFGGKFFERDETYIGSLSIFLVGHPQWIFYLVSLIVLYVLVQLYVRFVNRKPEERVPLYYLWVPTAIFVILISKYWLSSFDFWKLLVFS